MQIDVETYLQSDRIEQYCLGLLTSGEAGEVEQTARQYPAIRAELDWLTLALADYAVSEPAMPGPRLKSRVMQALSQLSDPVAFDLANLPLINAFADADQWQQTVAAIQPPESYKNIFGHVLRQDAEVEQFLIWVRHKIHPEDHHDERESFLILEGRCACSIGGELVELSAGDYFAVPLDLEHTVRVMSETPVKAILQRVTVA